MLPRVPEHLLSSRVYLSSARCLWKTGRSCRSAVLAVLTLVSITLVCRSAIAQVPDASRWANVSGWNGTATLSGNGGGSLPVVCPGGTDDYTNTQSVSAAPAVQGTFPFWFGPMNSNASVHISETRTCPPPFPFSCLDTLTGTGGAGLLDDYLDVTIDPTTGSYSLVAGAVMDAVGVDCSQGSVTGIFRWGPIVAPDGTLIGGGLPATNIPLPATGLDLTYTVPTYMENTPFSQFPAFPATWDIQWKLSPVCAVNAPDAFKQGKFFKQGDDPWGGKPYDNSPFTIGEKGCALTSLVMGLYYAGVTTLPDGTALDPLTFNNFLNSSQALRQVLDQHGFGGLDLPIETGFDGRNVKWDFATRYVSNFQNLKFRTFGPRRDSVSDRDGARQVLDESLCGANPHPVIVAVTGSDGKYPGHFVLVTGKDGDSYTIADPATGTMRSLHDYGDKFQTRGSVVDPSDNLGSLELTSDNSVSLLITDAAGNQTGLVPGSGQVLQQIPGSSYFVDQITDGDLNGIDSTGQPEPESHYLQVFQPSQGTYVAVVNGLEHGQYVIDIDAVSQDGSPQAPVVLKGVINAGASVTYQIKYAPAPGSTLTVLAMPGDLNGDGIVNCADLDIVKASFGKSVGQAGFDPRADVNGDGVVNILDLSTVAKQLPAGTTCH
jgi:hypothetical protein